LVLYEIIFTPLYINLYYEKSILAKKQPIDFRVFARYFFDFIYKQKKNLINKKVK